MDSGSSIHMFFFFFMFMFSFTHAKEAIVVANIHNVLKYGAVLDGKTDSSESILAAWNKACGSKGTSVVWIPRGTYSCRSLVLKGPCRSGPILFDIQGLLKASTNHHHHHRSWITFLYVDRLSIIGAGSLDAQGTSSGHNNSTSVGLEFITNSRVYGINGKNIHLDLFQCKNVQVKYMKISSRIGRSNAG